MSSELVKQIDDHEQRHLHVASQIRVAIPLQVRAMRESRGWTQTCLAEKLGTTQNAISRLENPASGKPNIGTLERLAEAFDVGLLVRFAPFSEFVKTVDGMSNNSVAIPNYETEKAQGAFQEPAPQQKESDTVAALSGSVAYNSLAPALNYHALDPKWAFLWHVPTSLQAKGTTGSNSLAALGLTAIAGDSLANWVNWHPRERLRRAARPRKNNLIEMPIRSEARQVRRLQPKRYDRREQRPA